MNDTVQKIKDRLNIIDVITPYVELHQAGRHFKGKSPFSNEKTPSFNVSPERGMYYCFSTSQGGDMFTFIQTIEKVDFKEALKILAEKAGVELVAVSPEKQSEQERVYSILDDATKFYEASLIDTVEAKEYLKKRGVSEATIKTWRIGAVPAGWRLLKDHLTAKGYTIPEMLRAGLVKEGAEGKDPYDVFRNRIMFPIFNQSGKVVAFSGRTLETGPEIPKYVNSPETELFKKSDILYGYDKAKHGIRHLDFSLIVEGQFDVVMCHQAGYSNTVAVSGTAFTLHHVQLLERSSKKVVLALDGDRAGIAAVKRSADLMLRRGLDVKVAVLPDGKDPADIILSDIQEFKNFIGKSVHVIDFLLQLLVKEGLEERTFKLRAREEVLPYVLLLPNHIDQDHFENRIAEALNTTKEAVHFEVERLSELSHVTEQASASIAREEMGEKAKNKIEPAKRYESVLAYLFGVIPILEDDVVVSIKKIIEDVTGSTLDELREKVTVSSSTEVTFRVEASLDNYPRKVFEEDVVHSLNQLREIVTRKRLNIAKEKLREAEQTNDIEVLTSSLKTVKELQEALQEAPYTQEFLKQK
jgi:DNA primase